MLKGCSLLLILSTIVLIWKGVILVKLAELVWKVHGMPDSSRCHADKCVPSVWNVTSYQTTLFMSNRALILYTCPASFTEALLPISFMLPWMEQVKLDSGIATNTFIKRYPQKEQRAHDFFYWRIIFFGLPDNRQYWNE